MALLGPVTDIHDSLPAANRTNTRYKQLTMATSPLPHFQNHTCVRNTSTLQPLPHPKVLPVPSTCQQKLPLRRLPKQCISVCTARSLKSLIQSGHNLAMQNRAVCVVDTFVLSTAHRRLMVALLRCVSFTLNNLLDHFNTQIKP